MASSRVEFALVSPFKFAKHAESYGMDPYYQADLVKRAMESYLKEVVETNRDLRRGMLAVEISPDGLSVEIRRH